MGDFTIKLNAELDLQNIKKQIENLDNASLELTNVNIDTGKISKSITKAFDKSYTVKIDTSSITKQIEGAVKAGLNTTGGGKTPKSTSPATGVDKSLARIEAQKAKQIAIENAKHQNRLAYIEAQRAKQAAVAEARIQLEQVRAANRLAAQQQAHQQRLELQQSRAEQTTVRNANQIRRRIDDNTYYARNQAVAAKLTPFSGLSDTDGFRTVQSSINNATEAYQSLLNARNAFDNGSIGIREFSAAFDEYDIAISRANNDTKQFLVTQGQLLTERKKSSLQNSITLFGEKNTKAVKAYRQEYEDLVKLADEMQFTGQGNVVQDRFAKLQAKASKEGNLGLTSLDQIKRGFKQIGQFASTYGIYQRMFDAAERMVQNVVDVDTAMTELRKVSDATDTQIDNYLQNATVHAKEYGAAVSDVVNATADWSRLGYSLPEAEQLTKASLLYKNVGDNMTMDDVSENLISTLQGFQLDSSEAVSIIDKFNEVGNNYAIDTKGLGEALKRSAASFNAANTDLSQAIALVTATNEVVDLCLAA